MNRLISVRGEEIFSLRRRFILPRRCRSMKNRWLLVLPALVLLGIGVKFLLPKRQIEIEDGMGNIANISILYRKYIEQHEGRSPSATDEKSFLDALRPYAPKPGEIDDFFIDPITQDHYRVNPWFNGKSIKE